MIIDPRPWRELEPLIDERIEQWRQSLEEKGMDPLAADYARGQIHALRWVKDMAITRTFSVEERLLAPEESDTGRYTY